VRSNRNSTAYQAPGSVRCQYWHVPATDPQSLDDINAYYDATWFDYRALWLNPDNRALHFGYWRDGITSHAESLTEMNRVIADSVRLQEGERVLDAGCGVGGTSFWLAEERGARVAGITPVHGQVERALRYTQKRGHDARAAFAQADYRAAPFAADSFDVVWAQESLCHAADKSQFTREAARLLRPDGRLVITEYLRRDRALPERDEQLLQRWLSGWAIPDIITRNEMTDMLVASGFTDVVVQDITDAMRPSLRRLHHITMGVYPIALALRTANLRNDVQHGNVIAARDQWRAMQRGLWRFGLITARKQPA
jgi:tocopherol O-methyltransferase